MTTLAAVDCGVNSLRLLINQVEVMDGVLEIMELHRLMKIVRLGQRVGATDMLIPEALERVREALTRYAELMQVEKIQAVRMMTVSATRDANNHDDFFAMTRKVLASWGTEAEVITGEEETALSLHGAVDDLGPGLGPYCIINVGNDSTEVIVGDHDGTVAGSDSVAMGSVRLTERFLQSSSPTAEQVQEARSYVAELTGEIVRQVPVSKARTIIGCAGTFTTLSALAQDLGTYDPEAIHLSQLRSTASHALTASVVETNAESLTANPVIHPKRADIFAGDSIIVDGLMGMFEALPLSKAAKEEQRFFYISKKDIPGGTVASLVDTHIAH